MNSFYKYILLISIIVFTISTLFSQEGYNIKVKIEGSKDTTLLLTSYFGEKIKLVDTAYVDDKEVYRFLGENKLPGGIYMIVTSGKKKLFEFIIGNNQDFTLKTDTIDVVKNMSIIGSDENQVFFSYLKRNEKYYQKSKMLTKEIDSLSALSLETSEIETKRQELSEETIDYKLNIINEHEELFVGSLLNSMRDIEIPDSVENSSDSTLSFKYYKEHYWDYLDLSDSCMLRTPIFMKKVKQYFSQLVVFNPDSVIVAIDTVISRSRPSNEVTGYLVWHFISEYQNPKFMGFDKVFVHLVDNYFSKEDIQNTTPSILNSLQERADKLRPILLDMPAPDLLLIDSIGSIQSFRSITNKYTVILFWDSECGICGKEITELQKIYDNPEYDVEVFAVNVNSDLEMWKKAVREKKVPGINVNGTRSATEDFHDLYDIYGTPVIYVLNSEKRIIAKRIGADKIIGFIDSYEKLQ